MEAWSARSDRRPQRSPRAHAWHARICNEPLEIFAIDRHAIKRGRFLAGCLAEKQDVLIVDPTTVPTKECFRRYADRFLGRDLEGPERGRRSVPIFAVVFFAHIDGKQQKFSIGRDRDSSVPTHAAVWNGFLDLPLREHASVETDLIDVGHVLAKDRSLVARPSRGVKRGLVLGPLFQEAKLCSVPSDGCQVPDLVFSQGEENAFSIGRPHWIIR